MHLDCESIFLFRVSNHSQCFEVSRELRDVKLNSFFINHDLHLNFVLNESHFQCVLFSLERMKSRFSF